MHPETDRHLSDLLRRAQDGDRTAYERFLLEAKLVLRRFFEGQIRGSPHLDDLVQETLIAIHRHRHTYDPGRPISPWIHAIARHRLVDLARAERRKDEHELSYADGRGGRAASDQSHAEGRTSLLRGALEALSAAQREVIWLLKFEGHSVAEVAAKTRRTPASVKVTAHRGYQALRKRMARNGDDE